MKTAWTSTPTTPPPARKDEADQLLLIGLVIAAVVIVVVLGTGHLSALLVHHHWPRYRTRDIPGTLYRVARNPGNPGRAWDPVNRGAAPPGPVLWWLSFAALTALIATPALLLHRRQVEATRPAGAQWATRRTSRRLRVRSASKGRVVLGRDEHDSLIAAETNHSALVFGPTRSGKTTGLILPALLEWQGPVLSTSIRGDIIEPTLGWRSTKGRVQIYDPAHSTCFTPAGWSPLTGAQDWGVANRSAWELAKAARACADEGLKMGTLWYQAAAKALAPMLHAAATTGRSIADVARWVDAGERDEITAILRPLNTDARLAHEARFRHDDRLQSSVVQIMQQVLGAYLDPAVAVSADRHDIVPADLLNGGSDTLFVVAHAKDQDRFRPLFTAMVDQVITAAYEITSRTGRPLDPPLLLLLDEAANVAPVEDLPLVASTGAALGVQLVTVFQDLSQMKLRYGVAAGTVVNNHRAKLFLPGISDLDTLDLASRLAGEQEVDRDSVTTDSTGRKSNTTAAQWRRLLPPDSVRQLGDDEAVLVYGNLPAVRLQQRPWFKDRRLRRRARTEAPATSATPETTGPDLLHATPALEPTTPPPSILDAARARRARQSRDAS